MKRQLTLLGLTATVVIHVASWAAAQGYAPARNNRRPQPLQRPSVSPYLNLLQFEQASDESLPVYQNLVRPFLDQRRINQYQVSQVYQLQQQVARNAAQSSRGEPVRQTGHLTSYQNHSHFFPNLYAPR